MKSQSTGLVGEALFTTYGNLRIRLVEATDILDGLQDEVDTSSTSSLLVFSSIGVLDDGEVKECYDSLCRPIVNAGASASFVDEHLFSVCSSYMLSISLFVVERKRSHLLHESLPLFAGYVLIPISRLGEGEVTQWYQLNSLKEDGLRTAVKVELCYDKLGSRFGTRLDADLSKSRKGSDRGGESSSRSTLTSRSEGGGGGVGGSGNNSSRRSNASSNSRDRGSEGGSAKNNHNGSNNSTASEIGDDNSEESQRLSAMSHGLVDYCLILGPITLSKSSFSPRLSRYNSIGHQSSSVASVHSQSRFGSDASSITTFLPHHLESDVCLWDRFPRTDYPEMPLPGKIEWFACPEGSTTVWDMERPLPRFSSFLLSTSTEAGETIEKFGITMKFFVACQSNVSAAEGPPSTASSVSSSSSSKTPSPKKSLGAVTPSPKSSLSVKPPSPKTSLNAKPPSPKSEGSGGDTPVPGRRPSFSRRKSASAAGSGADPNSSAISSTTEDRTPWWMKTESSTSSSEALPQGQNSNSRNKKGLSVTIDDPQLNFPVTHRRLRWVGVTIALLTQWPFVRQLSACLQSVYDADIYPRLSIWEERHLNSSAGISPRDSVSFSPFVLECSELLVKLCIDFPIPLPGLFSLEVKLASSVDSKRHHLTHRKLRNTASSRNIRDGYHIASNAVDPQRIRFQMMPSTGLPCSAYPLKPFFMRFGPRVAIDLVVCALFECKILFYSSDLSLLPGLCDNLRTLLYPFRWTHVYLPVVPSTLMDLFEAPVPYILGTHSDWISLIPRECLEDVVLVDVDASKVFLRNATKMKFPQEIDRWLIAGTKMILSPLCGLEDNIGIGTLRLDDQSTGCCGDASSMNPVPSIWQHHVGSARSVTLRKLFEFAPRDCPHQEFLMQLLYFDTMVNLLRGVPQCLFFLSPTHPVFNRPLFLEKHSPKEYKSFLVSLTDTNLFNQLVENIYCPTMSFFLEAIRFLNENEDCSSIVSPVGGDSGKVVVASTVTKKGLAAQQQALHRHRSERWSVESLIGAGSGSEKSLAKDERREPPVAASKASDSIQASPAPLTPSLPQTLSRMDAEINVKMKHAKAAKLFPDWVQNYSTGSRMPSRKRRNAPVPYFTIALRNILIMRLCLYEPLLEKLTVEAYLKNNGHKKWSERVLCVEVSDSNNRRTKHQLVSRGMMSNQENSVTSDQRSIPSFSVDTFDSNSASKHRMVSGSEANERNLEGAFKADSGNVHRTASMEALPVAQRSPRYVLSRKETSTSKSIDLLIAQRRGVQGDSANSLLQFKQQSPVATGEKVLKRVPTSKFSSGSNKFAIDQTGFAQATLEEQQHCFTFADYESHDEEDEDGRGSHRDSLDSSEDAAAGKELTISRKSVWETSFQGSDSTGEKDRQIIAALLQSRDERDCEIEKQTAEDSEESAQRKNLNISTFFADSQAGGSSSNKEGSVMTANGRLAPIIFDENQTSALLQTIEPWTVHRVADCLGIALNFADEIFSIVLQRERAANSFGPHGSSGEKFQLQLPIKEDGCMALLSSHLQRIMSATSAFTEQDLIDLLAPCRKSLESAESRKLFVSILRNSSNARNGGRLQDPLPDIFQIPSIAMDALSRLFTITMQICSTAKDYITAFELLELAGQYYHVREDFGAEGARRSSDADGGVEFLSSRVCQHPLFQSSLFWRQVMNHRLPMKPSSSDSKLEPDSVVYEAHSLLHLMHEIGVNADRALLFIQALARDYQLEVNKYFELQRFTGRLWSNNPSMGSQPGDLAQPSAISTMEESEENGMDQDDGGEEEEDSVKSQLGLNRDGLQIDTQFERTNSGQPTEHSRSPLSWELARSHETPAAASISGVDGTIPLAQRNPKVVTFAKSPQASPENTFRKVNAVGLRSFSSHTSYDAPRGGGDLEASSPLRASNEIACQSAETVKSLAPDVAKSDEIFRSTDTVDTSSAKNSATEEEEIEKNSASSSLSSKSSSSASSSLSFSVKSKGADEDGGAVTRVKTRSKKVVTQPLTPFAELSYATKFGLYDGKIDYKAIVLDEVSSKLVSVADVRANWVLTGGPDGMLHINDMANGKVIWSDHHSFDTGSLFSSSFLVPNSNNNNNNNSNNGKSTANSRSRIKTGSSTYQPLFGGGGSHDRSNGARARASSGTVSLESFDGLTAAKFIPGGNCFVTACSTGMINIWQLPASSESGDSLRQTRSMLSIASASSQNVRGSGSWSLRKPKSLLHSLKAHKSSITALAVEPSEKVSSCLPVHGTNSNQQFLPYRSWFVASGDTLGGVHLTRGECNDADSVTTTSTTAGVHLTGGVSCLSFTGGSGQSKGTLDFLAVGTTVGMLEVYDLTASQAVYRLLAHTGAIVGVRSMRSHELLTYSTDRRIKLWDLRTKNAGLLVGDRYLEERVLGGDEMHRSAAGSITSVEVGGHDNSLVLSASVDGLVRLWDLRYDILQPCQFLRGHSNAVTSVQWNNKEFIQTASLDGTVRRWDSINGKCFQTHHIYQSIGVERMWLSTTAVAAVERGLENYFESAPVMRRNWMVTRSITGWLRAFEAVAASPTQTVAEGPRAATGTSTTVSPM